MVAGARVEPAEWHRGRELVPGTALDAQQLPAHSGGQSEPEHRQFLLQAWTEGALSVAWALGA